METNIDSLREAFVTLTKEYIRALQDQEIGPLGAMKSLSGDAINEWINATNVADEVNGRRLSAREDLLAAMRAGS
jgi:hypothetical protein